MESQKQREIARKGGMAAHQKGTAHEFTKDEARAAGRKGGERVSINREHMSRIGRIGGKSSAGRRQAAKTTDSHPGQQEAGGAERVQSDSNGHGEAQGHSHSRSNNS